MTPEQRRRAVEVMARDMFDARHMHMSSDARERKWNSTGISFAMEDYAEDALTAPLQIADVTMKEEG